MKRSKGWNKFGAKKEIVDGITFASKAEAKDYFALRLRRLVGEITELTLQPKFPLIVNGVLVGSYKADFLYREGYRWVAHERKGFKARDWSLRSKLFMALHPEIELRINGVAAKRPKPPKPLESQSSEAEAA